MTLKRYFLLLMAALAVIACTPGVDLDDNNDDPQEQTGPDDSGNTQEEAFADVRIDDVVDISDSDAILQGSFGQATGVPEEAGFEWGLSASQLDGKLQSTSSISGQSGRFSVTITGLSPETEYFIRAYVRLGESTFYSDTESFTTEATQAPPTTQASQPGWFELPIVNASRNTDGYLVDNNNPDLYYAYHKSDIGTRNYTVCYNGAYHCPVWVAGPRHEVYSRDVVDRQDSYDWDPGIPKNVQQQALKAGSGCQYNRGHMIGSDERTGSLTTNKQMFYITNIAPQDKDTFNTGKGAWNILEAFVDRFECPDTLYIVIGTYFETFTDAYGNTAQKQTDTFMGSTVQIPTAFYYALLRTKSGDSGKNLKDCSRDEIQCAAFIRSHTCKKGTAVSSAEMKTIDYLEELTGFDFFPFVPNAPEDSFNPADWGL